MASNSCEDELKQKIVERLSKYFHIRLEYPGTFYHWGSSKRVLLDLALFPKKNIIKTGLPRYFFGVEVKCFNLNSEDPTAEYKTVDTIHQCLTYKFSKFGKRNIEPAFILLADNFSIDSQMDSIDKDSYRNYIINTSALKQFAFRFNIGRLIIRDQYIGFKLQNTFWSNTGQFSNEDMLLLYAGNRQATRNKDKAIKLYIWNPFDGSPNKE